MAVIPDLMLLCTNYSTVYTYVYVNYAYKKISGIPVKHYHA